MPTNPTSALARGRGAIEDIKVAVEFSERQKIERVYVGVSGLKAILDYFASAAPLGRKEADAKANVIWAAWRIGAEAKGLIATALIDASTQGALAAEARHAEEITALKAEVKRAYDLLKNAEDYQGEVIDAWAIDYLNLTLGDCGHWWDKGIEKCPICAQLREMTTAKEAAEATSVALARAARESLAALGTGKCNINTCDGCKAEDQIVIAELTAALTPDLAALVAQHKAGQRAAKALGAIAAAVVTENLNEVYYQCYKALVGDLALPADTQREIMREAMQEYLRANSEGTNAG